MWAPNEAAKKAANGTHTAIRIDNLQFDEGSSETPRLSGGPGGDGEGWLSPPQMAKANRGSSGCELARPVVRLMRTKPHHRVAPRRFICFGIAAPDGAKCPGSPLRLPFVMRCAACRCEREKARGSMEPRGEFSN